MIKNQRGSTLVFILVLIGITTVLVVTGMERSDVQQYLNISNKHKALSRARMEQALQLGVNDVLENSMPKSVFLKGDQNVAVANGVDVKSSYEITAHATKISCPSGISLKTTTVCPAFKVRATGWGATKTLVPDGTYVGVNSSVETLVQKIDD